MAELTQRGKGLVEEAMRDLSVTACDECGMEILAHPWEVRAQRKDELEITCVDYA